MKYKKKKIKFSNVLEEWLLLQQYFVKESTYVTYSIHIQRHIIPYFKDAFIKDITHLEVQEFINVKLKSGRLDKQGGLSIKSVKELLNVIKLALKYAIKNNYINSFDFSFKFPSNNRQMKLLDSEEHLQLVTYLKEDVSFISKGILLVLCTGLRIGEVCALKNSDIDLECKVLHINKTLQRISNLNLNSTKIIISTTKTTKSDRIIPIPDTLLPYLKIMDKNSYFLTQNQNYIEPRTLRYNFKRILKKLHLTEVTMHSLRHYFASQCIELGFDYNCLSEILGHSSPSTTMNLYVHSKNEYKKICMNKIEI